MRLVIITINLNSESQLKARHGSTVTINIFINDYSKRINPCPSKWQS